MISGVSVFILRAGLLAGEQLQFFKLIRDNMMALETAPALPCLNVTVTE